MLYKSIGSFLALLAAVMPTVHGQNSLESGLAAVRSHNAQIATMRQYIVAQKLQNHTGIAPEDPFVEGDYLIGRPISGGNQVDFAITQTFDFPTVYRRKNQLAQQKDQWHNYELERVEKEVLWEAKQIGLKLIHLNKKEILLRQKLVEAETTLRDFEHKYAVSEISQLTLNKARIRFLGVEHDLRHTQTEIQASTQALIQLNGGLPLSIADTSYPSPNQLEPLQALQADRIANDPSLRLLHQRQRIAETHLQVHKALALPRFETGYHYQSVLGQTFNGIHLGASIPLWNRRKQVQAQAAMLRYSNQASAAQQLAVAQDLQQLYIRYEGLQNSLQSYKEALQGLNTRLLLAQSLRLGEIDFIAYATELDYYYAAFEKFLEIEHTYYHTISEILKSNL